MSSTRHEEKGTWKEVDEGMIKCCNKERKRPLAREPGRKAMRRVLRKEVKSGE